MGLKAHLMKHDFQVDLNQKREMLEVLVDRLEDLAEV